jgi:hypothetical protein
MGNTLFGGVQHTVLDKVFYNDTVKHCTILVEEDGKTSITFINGTFSTVKAKTVSQRCCCCFTKTHNMSRVFINANVFIRC